MKTILVKITLLGHSDQTNPHPLYESIFSLQASPGFDYIDICRFECLLENRDAFDWCSLTTHEHVKRCVTSLWPRVNRDMALWKHKHSRDSAIRLKVMQMTVKNRRARHDGRFSQCVFNNLGVVKVDSAPKVNQEMVPRELVITLLNEVIFAVRSCLPVILVWLLNLIWVFLVIMVEFWKGIEHLLLLRVKEFVLEVFDPMDVFWSCLLVVFSVELTSVIDNTNIHLGRQHVRGEATFLNGDCWHGAIVLSRRQIRALCRNLLDIGVFRLLGLFWWITCGELSGIEGWVPHKRGLGSVSSWSSAFERSLLWGDF